MEPLEIVGIFNIFHNIWAFQLLNKGKQKKEINILEWIVFKSTFILLLQMGLRYAAYIAVYSILLSSK